MTNATLSAKEELLHVESSLPNLRELAGAEAAFDIAHPEAPTNPWRGYGKKKTEAEARRRDLTLMLKGTALAAAHAEQQSLLRQSAQATTIRTAAEYNVAQLKETPLIKRWLAAPSLARKNGWGHSFEQLHHWMLSGKSTAFAPECIGFFRSASCPPELRFDLVTEREEVRRFYEAVASAENSLTAWSLVQDRLQALFREHPELRHAQNT